jgi:adenosylmethionine-8-amino-7-oxononanoate aminotransferase
MEREGHRICAVIVEPMVQAAAGILTHDASFLRGVRDLCDEFGAFLVADEIATGLGRTGKQWALDHAGVVPDLLTLGKGVTGGYLPLSAVLASEEIYEAFLGAPDSARTFFHGHSYTANPLCCAAAIANLKLMDANDTVGNAAHLGEVLSQRLAHLDSHHGVVEVRQLGTMTGIEVSPVEWIERTGFEICQIMKNNGVLTRPLGDVVVLMPPLAMNDTDLNTVVDVCISAIDQVAG